MTVIKEGRMKAYLFIEGETRQAKKGEWYMTSRGEIYYVEGTVTCGERNVLTRHEIEIPDGAHTMTVQTRGACNTLPAMHIPIPRPKVRRWQWVKDYGGSEAKMEIRSTERYTRQELDAILRRNNLNTCGWHSDNDTMIEVEE
jgi:hypothetical protein